MQKRPAIALPVVLKPLHACTKPKAKTRKQLKELWPSDSEHQRPQAAIWTIIWTMTRQWQDKGVERNLRLCDSPAARPVLTPVNLHVRKVCHSLSLYWLDAFEAFKACSRRTLGFSTEMIAVVFLPTVTFARWEHPPMCFNYLVSQMKTHNRQTSASVTRRTYVHTTL